MLTKEQAERIKVLMLPLVEYLDSLIAEPQQPGTITAEQPSDAPVAKVRVHRTGGNAGIAWSAVPVNEHDSLPILTDETLLYASHQPPGTITAKEHQRIVREAVKAAYERAAEKCIKAVEGEMSLWRGTQDVTDFRLAIKAIRASMGESDAE